MVDYRGLPGFTVMVPVFPPVLEGAPVPTPPLVAPGLAGDVVVAGDVLVPGVVVVGRHGPATEPIFVFEPEMVPPVPVVPGVVPDVAVPVVPVAVLPVVPGPILPALLTVQGVIVLVPLVPV
ncbi:MAG TPA: hypothetical protein VE734_11920, partial [Terriglobales bacterium]|nr:hypothetical protein [Terriglobales bacterium]